jgi:hypothetical protein
MIAKSKMFVVSNDVDDSIKSQAASYDITIFKSFLEFEKYANETPVVLESLIISANELPFNGTNMNRLLSILSSPFMEISGTVTYLIDYNVKLENVNAFLEMRGISNWAIYQGVISLKFITDIVTGAGRTSAEGQNEVITYRVRASDYIKQQNQLKYENDENKYYTDEDELSDIPDVEEPVEIAPAEEFDTTINYIVGDDILSRALMSFFVAQYLALREKTVIVERDYEYHTLSEIVTKSGVDCEFIPIDDFLDDVGSTLVKITSSLKSLVVIGCHNRRTYDYNFILDLLESNLNGEVPHIIRECNIEEIPYGKSYTIVVNNTVPAVLKCCNTISAEINPERVTFIGMQTANLGPMNLTSEEMKSIIEIVLNINNVAAQVVHVNGIVLKKEEVVYDILRVLNRGNRR